MSWLGRCFACVGALLGLNWQPASCFADEDGCARSYTEVQLLRRDSRLLLAQQRAIECAQDECSVTVRADCARWLDEIERAVPTISFKAEDPAGIDLMDVRVWNGAVLVTSELRGRALAFDPGEYVFQFEHDGQSLERRAVIHEGEKSRLIGVRFPALPRTAPLVLAPASVPSSPPPQQLTPADGARRLPGAGYALAALAVAGGVTFLALGTSGYLSERHLRATCAPLHACDRADIESIRTRYIAADVALGFGLLSLASAGAVYFLSSGSETHGSALNASGTGFNLKGEF